MVGEGVLLPQVGKGCCPLLGPSHDTTLWLAACAKALHFLLL